MCAGWKYPEPIYYTVEGNRVGQIIMLVVMHSWHQAAVTRHPVIFCTILDCNASKWRFIILVAGPHFQNSAPASSIFRGKVAALHFDWRSCFQSTRVADVSALECTLSSNLSFTSLAPLLFMVYPQPQNIRRANFFQGCKGFFIYCLQFLLSAEPINSYNLRGTASVELALSYCTSSLFGENVVVIEPSFTFFGLLLLCKGTFFLIYVSQLSSCIWT